MREREIEQYLVTRCRNVGVLCYKWASPGRVGVPDRICVFPDGRVVFVEVKAPGKKPTRAQLREHARMREYGQTVVVVDSVESVDSLFSRSAHLQPRSAAYQNGRCAIQPLWVSE